VFDLASSFVLLPKEKDGGIFFLFFVCRGINNENAKMDFLPKWEGGRFIMPLRRKDAKLLFRASLIANKSQRH